MCNSLEAMLQVKKGKENAVIKKINKNRQSFPKIRKVEKYNDNHVIVSYLATCIISVHDILGPS